MANLRPLIKLAYCAVIIALLAASSAYALVNGMPLTETDTLVRINFGGSKSVCTGFFVNPTTILTAAHCLYSAPTMLWSVSELSISNDVVLAVTVERLVPHPLYRLGEHQGNDIGLIKTSAFATKNPMFKLSKESPMWWGTVDLMGAGKIDIARNVYGRSRGTSSYFRFGSDIYIMGRSQDTDHPGKGVTIAPNDSGGPILEPLNGEVIAVASRTTVTSTSGTVIPAISIGTLLNTAENQRFILENLSRNPSKF